MADEIAKLEALYASNPEGRVFTHLAEAYRKAGDYERARTILEQGLAKHPAYASAHVVLGRVFIDLNQAEEATESFRRVLQLDPHNLVALRSLGDLARAAGRNAEALGYFEELRHQDPTNEELEGIIADLLASPGPGVEAPQPAAPATVTPATAEPEPVAPPAAEELPPMAAAAAEPEPSADFPDFGNLPDLAPPEPDFGDLVSPDVDLDWTTPAAAEANALPGDLADFASLSAAPDSPDIFGDVDLGEPEPEMPSDTGAFDVDFGEAPPAYEAAPEAVQPEPEPVAVGEPAAESETFDFGEMGTVTEEPQQAGLVTETMAELYRNQGLHERAAEVYRALLRDRPDDSQLLAKLDEVETLARSEETVSAAPEAPPMMDEPVAEELPVYIPSAPEAAEEPAVAVTASNEEEVDSPWTGSSIATANAPTPYAWAEEQATEVDAGPAVTEYFRNLLGWRPKAAEAAAAAPAPAAIAEEPAILELGEPLQTAEEPLFEEVAAPPTPPAPSAPATPSPAASADELMPWEEPVAAPPAPAAAAPVVTEQAADDAFDEWFSAPEPAVAESAAPAPTAEQPAEAASGEGEGEDDDDLEMFRSWLQSLKK